MPTYCCRNYNGIIFNEGDYIMKFYKDKDLGLCGLACVLCNQDECPGCKARGSKEGSDCSVYKCATEKGFDGCYSCNEFACNDRMLQGVRSRAFNQYARQFGKHALLNRLHDNFKNGITYHKTDGTKGDYDSLETEEEIMQLIQFGKSNPYIECPTFETEHFVIRLISETDAKDLLCCYGDPKARLFFNNDDCPKEEYDYINRMHELIDGWLNHDYAKGYYIRFSIINKQTQKAVGTIEIYDRKYQQSERTTGILRIDIAHLYERDTFLTELFTISSDIFFNIFHVKIILHKAIPQATERISVMTKIGFRPIKIEGRQHYWVYKK